MLAFTTRPEQLYGENYKGAGVPKVDGIFVLYRKDFGSIGNVTAGQDGSQPESIETSIGGVNTLEVV